MKWLPGRAIWPYAALAVAAAALLAWVVGGRQDPPPAPAAADSRQPARSSMRESPSVPELKNLRRMGEGKSIPDLFAPAPVAATAGEQEPPPPAAPTAPPLPFTYLGRIIDGDKLVVFLGRGDEHYAVAAGQTIEQLYKVEQVTETTVTFTYLPMRTRQILPIPPHTP